MCASTIQSYVEVGSAGPIDKEHLVEFHLLYEGPLHTDRSDKSRSQKHQIRRVFNRQLRRLWYTQPNLRRMACMQGWTAYAMDWTAKTGGEGSPPPITELEQIRWGTESFAKRWERCGVSFLPLVTPDLCLRCSLEILFLRMEERDWILQGGDIDGRVHVLFDALRMFRDCNDKPNGLTFGDGEFPMFCLLQDDTRGSDVSIDTGQLLLLPDKEIADEHDVYLQITVRLNPVQHSQYGWVFE